MTESNHGHVYRESVQIGDTEMTIEYGDVNWGDFELPPMALEISGANYHAQLEAVRKFLSWQKQADAHSREEIERGKQLVKAASGEVTVQQLCLMSRGSNDDCRSDVPPG